METRIRTWATRGRLLGLIGRAAACMVLVLSVSGEGRAQTGETRLVLGLPDLIRMAVAVSPEMAQRQSEAAAARSELAQARAGYLPQFDSTAVAGPVNDAHRPLVSDGRIIDPSPSRWDIGAFGRLDFTMAQPLYTFGKLSNRRDAAEHGLAAQEVRQVQTSNEIALRVKELYYGLVASRAGMEAAKEAGSFFDEARARMDRLLKLGSPNVIESDVYRVDAYRADIVRGRAEAEKGANISYYALKSLVGLPKEKDFDPAEKTLAFKEEELDREEAYIEKALAERPEFKQLDQALAAQGSLVEATRSDRYPSFFAALTGSLAGAPGREALHNPYIPDDFNHTLAGVVTGVHWHFDFGILKGRIEKEKAEYERLLHTKSVAQLNIPIQVVKSYQEVREWRVATDAYQKAASASRRWIVSALTNFDMGTGTADDLLRGIERYGQNQGRYVEALYNYHMSIAQLEYAMGVKSW